MTTEQNKPPVECDNCKKAGVKDQLIDFIKIGVNPTTGKDMWQRLDHGTQNLHLHRKLCENGCNTVIIFDQEERRFRDFTSERELHNCRNNPEKYRAIAEQHKNIIVSLETKVLSNVVAQPQQQENPIQSVISKEKEDPNIAKKVQLIWALVSNNQAKIDDISKKATAIDARMNTFMDSYQKLEAAIKSVLENPSQFVTGKQISDRTKTTEQMIDYPEGEIVD